MNLWVPTENHKGRFLCPGGDILRHMGYLGVQLKEPHSENLEFVPKRNSLNSMFKYLGKELEEAHAILRGQN